MTKNINFNLDSTVNYAGLQDQLVGLMQEQLLGTAAFSASRECQPDGLNLCMFIRQEGDVFMPHIVADRNYLFVSSESGERLVNRFSAVFVPGEWMKQRLLGSRSVTLRADQIFVVGSPRVDILRKRQAEVGAKQAAAKPSVLLAFGRQTKKKRGQVDEASVAAANARGALQLALREAGFEVLDVPHPCDRDDKQPIMDELLSADIVVSDTSSVVYEAWALGKPVIFPRWLVDIDNVVGAAGTAEALIYRNRIGLHAETLEELVDMAATDPTIGVDVDRFMTTYLDNYRSGNASQKVAKLLLRLSDPDTYEKESWAERQMAEVSGLARLRAPEKPDPIRVSIQLLQLQLINGHFEDFDASRRSLGLLPLNRSVSEGVSGLVLESSLMRGEMSVAMRELESWRSTSNSSLAQAYGARVAMLSGDWESALEQASVAARSSTQPLALCALFGDILEQAGFRDIKWSFLLDVCRTRNEPQVLSLLATQVADAQRLQQFEALAAGCSQRDDSPVAVAAIAQARLLAGDGEGALSAASAFAFRLLTEKKLLAKVAAANFQPDAFASHPQWLVPPESLPAAKVRGTMAWQRFKVATMAAARAISNGAAKAFPMDAALLAWKNEGSHGEMHDGPRFGAIGESHFGAACHAIAKDPHFTRVCAQVLEGKALYRHASGIVVSVIQHDVDGDGLVWLDRGIESRIEHPDFTMETRSGVSVLVPEDMQQYLSCTCVAIHTQSAPELLHVAGAPGRVVVDRAAYATHVYLAIADALVAGDAAMVASLARELIDQGDFQMEVLLQTGFRYPGEDFLDRVRQAKYLIHVGDGAKAAFHIDLWLEFCASVDPSLLIAVRSKELYLLLVQTRPELPVVFIKEGVQAEWLVTSCPQLAGVLYVSNTGNTVHFLRFPHLNHIFLGHGDSEKSASCHKFFRAYDEVWTAGQAHVDRFRNSGINFSSIRFRSVGRPLLRGLLQQKVEIPTGKFLWLPTWEGYQTEQDFSSVGLGLEFVPEIARITGKSVRAKFHPLTGVRVNTFVNAGQLLETNCVKASVQVEVAPREALATDLMAGVDFLVADISSVVTDFLCTGKPVFLFMPGERNLRTSSSAMSLDSYCYVFSDAGELGDLVRRVVVEGDDPLKAQRAKALAYYIDIDATADSRFEAELANVIRESVHAGEGWRFLLPVDASDAPVGAARTRIIGHRGAKGVVAENSLEGFRRAISLGVDGIELDIHRTADGALVVIHDPTLDRTTNGSGAISRMTLDEVRGLRLNGTDESVPLLSEVFEVAAGTGVEIHVELKSDHRGEPYEGMHLQVIEMAAEAGVLDRIVLTAFSPVVLEDVRRTNAAIPLVAAINYRSAEILGGLDKALQRFLRIEGCTVALDRGIAKPSIDELETHAGRFGIWVVNEPDELRYWIGKGVYQVTTDQPEKALMVRKKMEQKQ